MYRVSLSLVFLSLTLACAGAPTEEETDGCEPSSADDADDTEDGEVSVDVLFDVSGSWVTSLGTEYFVTDCTATVSASSESWINSMEITQSATEITMVFNLGPEETFYGSQDPEGGVTLSGPHVHASGALYAQFGGLAYHDAYIDRDVIDGSVFLGLDADGDGTIDCTSKGSWIAVRSGV